MTHTLLQHDELLAVVRLGPGADVPYWATSGTVFSVTATAAETSIVCAVAGVPRKAQQHGPYVAFEVEGPRDPAVAGALISLLEPLAEAGVHALTLATHDTEWILAPVDDTGRATEAWRRRGHTVHPAPSSID